MGKDSTPTKLFFNREIIPPDAMTASDGEEGEESEAVKGKEQGKDQGKGKGKKRVDDCDGNDTKKKKGKS